MSIVRLCVALCLVLVAAAASAADAGIYTLVEGESRVLRATTWYKLAAGARLQPGDIVAAAAKSSVQIEMTTGSALSLGGPVELYAAAVQGTADKPAAVREFFLANGWLKFAGKAAVASVRVRAPTAVFDLAESIAVIRVEPDAAGIFIETGTVKLAEVDAGKDGPARDAKAGEYWRRPVGQPFGVERRAPAAFVAAMPRHLVDPLPNLAGRFKEPPPKLVAEREVSFAEVAPWLAGPYRKALLKRFEPRLKDREFRSAVEARILQFPEWDRLLHPEKYSPKPPAQPK